MGIFNNESEKTSPLFSQESLNINLKDKEIEKLINENIPFLTLGGVFVQGNSVTDQVKEIDKQSLQTKIISLFTINK
jgi:Tfp pilus assembly protein PilZ